MKLLDWRIKFLIRCGLNVENVLVKLKPGRNINGDISALLKCKVLSLVWIHERVSKDLELSTEVVLNDIIIGGEELLRLNVPKENRLSGLYGFSLSFKAVVWVQAFYYPNCVESILGVK